MLHRLLNKDIFDFYLINNENSTQNSTTQELVNVNAKSSNSQIEVEVEVEAEAENKADIVILYEFKNAMIIKGSNDILLNIPSKESKEIHFYLFDKFKENSENNENGCLTDYINRKYQNKLNYNKGNQSKTLINIKESKSVALYYNNLFI